MSMKATARAGSWKLTDAMWTKMEPLLPKRPAHPLGCHRPRGPDRNAMAAIRSESHRARRKLETDRCHVDQDGAAAAQASGTSTRMSPSTGPRPQRHGSDPIGKPPRAPEVGN